MLVDNEKVLILQMVSNEAIEIERLFLFLLSSLPPQQMLSRGGNFMTVQRLL
jgi:hypothetical protein